MANQPEFRRVYRELHPEGYLTVQFSPDGTTGEVSGAIFEAADAVKHARSLAKTQKLKLAAYVLRRDQWNSSWGVLV